MQEAQLSHSKHAMFRVTQAYT